MKCPHCGNAISDEFRPTHRHAEGGLYQVIGNIQVRLSGNWITCVLYKNEGGAQFARLAGSFAERFEPLPPIPAKSEGET